MYLRFDPNCGPLHEMEMSFDNGNERLIRGAGVLTRLPSLGGSVNALPSPTSSAIERTVCQNMRVQRGKC